MEFRVLGPLEAWRDDAEVPIAAGKHRALLATLLLRANRVVTTDALIARIWGDHPPGDARATAQTYVRRLRATLGADLIDTRPGGYLMSLSRDQLDLLRFDDLVERARREADPVREAELLDSALELWRGDALADVPSDMLHRDDASALTERRLQALERFFELGLQSGRYSDLVPELRQATAQHPLRERFCAQLMTALAGSGRQSDALRTYDELRHRLVDELGIDPGLEIQDLHRDILCGNVPAPMTTPPGPSHFVQIPPAQLPADVATFTGRQSSLDMLNSLLPLGTSGSAGVVTIALVEGMAGIGKTALAVHWGHQVHERFPDGQLYVNLRGHGASGELCAAEALAGFLAALGVPAGEIPRDVDRAAATYRSLLATKRMLIILDDVSDADQVRPLLPGSGSSFVLVTSRAHLAGLVAREGAVALPLDVLDPSESQDLLMRLLGSECIAAEQAAVNDLAGLCGNLPLALRIAAANLTRYPQYSLSSYVQYLQRSDCMTSLAVPGDADSVVSAAFDASYRRLSPPAQHLFRLVVLIPGADITANSAAAISGMSAADAEHILDDLASRHMLEARAPGCYTFHDLLRRYATARRHGEDGDSERHDALTRLYDYYVHGANAAASVLYPDVLRMPEQPGVRSDVHGFTSATRAMDWLNTERVNLVAAVAHTSVHGPPDVAWLIADALRGYFYVRGDTVEWDATVHAALAAARSERHVRAQAAATLSLSNLRWWQGRHDDALSEATEALRLAREAQWSEGQVTAHANLGAVCSNASRLDLAMKHLSEALDGFDLTNEAPGKGVVLGNLSVVNLQRGQLHEASTQATKALAINQGINARNAEASNRAALGEVQVAWGRFDVALDHFAHALSLYEVIANRVGMGLTLANMARAHRDAGRPGQALQVAYRAMELADDRDIILRADALIAVAAAHERLGGHQQARDCYDTALQLTQDPPHSYPKTEALLGLATICAGTGLPEQAIDLFNAALTLSRQSGYQMFEGHALTGLAAASLAENKVRHTIGRGKQALVVQCRTGHRLGQLRTHLVLARAHDLGGDTSAAKSHQQSAESISTSLGLPSTNGLGTGLIAEQLVNS